MKQHYKICKDKVKQEEIQKILDDKNKLEEKYKENTKKLEKKYKKNKKKLKEIEIENEEIKIENKEIKLENEELEKEYNDFLKKTANNLIKNKTTNIINHNNNTLNMHYVINNFTDAPNFEDQITEQLTNSQKEAIKSGPLTGCVKLINMKCIEDKKANERSIHCLDPSRRKFIIRVAQLAD